jgi:L-ascorbate metabolism protein UlaG (beta-lactamase superfamily)
MDIQFYGANCVTISTKLGHFVIDDNLETLGGKSVTKPDYISLFTSPPKKLPQAKLVIKDPGEYEVSEVSIFGISSRSHLDEPGQETATIYKIEHDDLRVVVLGHIHPDLSEDHLEEIGTVDILITPVGGNGYTLDPIGALQVIKKIEPKLVIPTHFDDASLNFPIPQQPLAEALKALGMEPKETLAKFKPKATDFSDTTQLIILERQ